LLVLVAAAALFLLTNVAFGGSFGRAAKHLPAAIVAWRVPGVRNESLPLADPTVPTRLLWDLFVVLAPLVGLLFALRRLRGRGLVLLLAILVAAGGVLWLRVEVNHAPLESHRFAIAAMFLAPLTGVTLLDGRTPEFSRLLLLAALALSAASTVAWVMVILPTTGEVYTGFFSPVDFTKVDCRAVTGARAFEPREVVYGEQSAWYLYAGCHPVVSPAVAADYWWLQIKTPLWGLEGFRAAGAWQAGRALRVVCSSGPTKDPACSWARARHRCAPTGNALLSCSLDEEDRRALLFESTR
jgi:hypothetical protein